MNMPAMNILEHIVWCLCVAFPLNVCLGSGIARVSFAFKKPLLDTQKRLRHSPCRRWRGRCVGPALGSSTSESRNIPSVDLSSRGLRVCIVHTR